MKIVHTAERVISHPSNPRDRIPGRLLKTGETLRKTDVYANLKTRKWQQIHPLLIGDRLQRDRGTVFVRPI